jgi:hypothetical protein
MITIYINCNQRDILRTQNESRTTFPQFPESYWLASTTDIPNFPKLSEDIQVDVAIVGELLALPLPIYFLKKD